MRAVPSEVLSKLQKRAKHIRNICILAHVDHGKTTLADTLVASNGIISQKMAGKLRYMDSLEEEQERGITMKSSAISLFFSSQGEHYLVNLIDSPGHIDFSSEVSTAVRLCDGAIVVIDAVEGVSPQTHAVLRQAWLEHIKPVLLVNKIDRLVTELRLSPTESYIHMQQILEQVNAYMAQLISGEILKKSTNEQTQGRDEEITDEIVFNWDSGQHADENDDAHLYFSPDTGNVVFGSALDGWAFSIENFAEIYAQKLGLNKKVLSKTLWGDFYFNPKTKKVYRGAQNAGKKSLFVQMILENIWKVYNLAMNEYRDMDQLEKVIEALNIKVPPRELKSTDCRVLTKSIMSQWLPITRAVLDMVAAHTPSPLEIGEERVEKLMCDHSIRFDSLHPRTKALKNDFLRCSGEDSDTVIVYVSKMFPVESDMFPENQQSVLTKAELEQKREIARQRHQQRMQEKLQQDEAEMTSIVSENTDIPETPKKEQYKFLAFARIFSGKLRRGQSLYVLGPKHNPAHAIEQGLELRLKDADEVAIDQLSNDSHIMKVTINDLYTFMGRELEAMQEVPAGNIVGIGGLEDFILKSGTLSSDVACPSFSSMQFEAQPIVRVAVEPVNAADMSKLMQGMKLLNHADPCVQIILQETGEHVLVTAGEVHLQRCCDDLRKRYAKIAINVSEPIVPFRETIIEPPTLDMVNEAIEGENIVKKNMNKAECKIIKMTKGITTVTMEALPLPAEVTQLLDKHENLLQAFDHHITQSMGGRLSMYDEQTTLNQQSIDQLINLKLKIEELLKSSSNPEWQALSTKIWSFGPKKYGPNILVNGVPGYNRPNIWSILENLNVIETEKREVNKFEELDSKISQLNVGDEVNSQSAVRDFDSSIVNGFQLATLSGPMCAEPMRGVAFVLRSWEINAPTAVSLVTEQEEAKSGEESDSASLVSSSKKCLPNMGMHSGQVISLVKEACLRAFQAQPQRLMCAMYSCKTQATAAVLGKVYGVLGKRNGRIISEDMQEGTQLFTIAATLPVAESFGFCDEMRKKTSGNASPQLTFSHWEVIDVDPYWEPSTEEEITHYGEKYDSLNLAKMYMNQIRKRKGLKTEEKLVVFAEKQRNLAKKK